MNGTLTPVTPDFETLYIYIYSSNTFKNRCQRCQSATIIYRGIAFLYYL